MSPLDTPTEGFVINLFAGGERYFPNTSAGLSLKTLLYGGEQFEVDGGVHSLEPGEAFIMNPAQEYASLLTEKASQNLCVTFGTTLVGEAKWAGEARRTEILDSPEGFAPIPVFLEKVYGREAGFDHYINQLLAAAWELDKSRLEESGLELLEFLLFQNSRAWSESAALGIKDETLRREAQQRLYRARDFIVATWNQKNQLEDWADVACMSRFHFLRLFKAAFQQTPRQFLIKVRLKNAATLIEQENRTMLEVALSCGFESASHFSRSFKRQFGVSPQDWVK
jgi:AraC family transcriptional regulator